MMYQTPSDVLICHLYIIFDKKSVCIFCPFSNGILCFFYFWTSGFFLNTLAARLLLGVWLTDTRLPVLWVVFSSSSQDLLQSKTLILMRSGLSVLLFIDLTFGVKFQTSFEFNLEITLTFFSPCHINVATQAEFHDSGPFSLKFQASELRENRLN